MFYLIGTITIADVDAFIAGAGSMPQEYLDESGVVEQNIYGSVDQNVVIIVNAYKTLEEAQNHKADIDSPQSWENHKQMGVESFDSWIVENRVAR